MLSNVVYNACAVGQGVSLGLPLNIMFKRLGLAVDSEFGKD